MTTPAPRVRPPTPGPTSVDELLSEPSGETHRPVYWILWSPEGSVQGVFPNESRPTALALETGGLVAPIILSEWRPPGAPWPGRYRPKSHIRPAKEIDEVSYWRTTLGIEVGPREKI